ncbi:hypothetical protein BDZ88DRAFT_508415 [Geranomyces variabilis]|nr:hypothetical protein BDZ88DRAFT_508415 [Geranomyces variabilis]KAJ3137039.1 hypothetical protein HDU90_002210 [Geranomyces variabilis]
MGCGASTAAGAKQAQKSQADVPTVVTAASPNASASAGPGAEMTQLAKPTAASSVTSPGSQRKLRLKPVSITSIERDNPPGTEVVQSPAQVVVPPVLPAAMVTERDNPPGTEVVQSSSTVAGAGAAKPTTATPITSPGSQRKLKKNISIASIQRDNPPGTEVVQSPVAPVLPTAVFVARDQPGGDETLQSPLLALQPPQPTAQSKPAAATANSAANDIAAGEQNAGQTRSASSAGQNHNRPGVSVFVTTGVGLDQERNLMETRIFPRAREAGSRAKVPVSYTDLRAGLPPHTPSDPTTLSTTLCELRAHRYRVIILGGPRGYRPDPSDPLSVSPGTVSPTEVSGDCGVEMELNAALELGEGQTVVFVRGKDVVDVVEEWGSVSGCNEDEGAAWQPVVEKLRRRGVEVKEYASMDELAGVLNGVLDSWIELEKHKNRSGDSWEMQNMHRIAGQAAASLSSPGVFEQLENAKGVVLLTGSSSTTVAAQWGVKSKRNVLPYFCGLSDEGCDAAAVLSRVTAELLGGQPAAAAAAATFPDVRESFHAALMREQQNPTAVVICGVEYLDHGPNEWMPDAKRVSAETSVILTTSTKFASQQLRTITLPPLSNADRNSSSSASALSASLVQLEPRFTHSATDILYPSSSPTHLNLNLPSAADGTANSAAAFLAILWATRLGRLPPHTLRRVVGLPHRTHAALLRSLEDARIVIVDSEEDGGCVRFGHPGVRKLVETRYIATGKRASGLLKTLASVIDTSPASSDGFCADEVGWMLARAGDCDALNKWLGSQKEKEEKKTEAAEWMRLRAKTVAAGSGCGGPTEVVERSAPPVRPPDSTTQVDSGGQPPDTPLGISKVRSHTSSLQAAAATVQREE